MIKVLNFYWSTNVVVMTRQTQLWDLHRKAYSFNHYTSNNILQSCVVTGTHEPQRGMQLGSMTIQITLRIFKSFRIFSDTISMMRQNSFHIWKLFSSNWRLILMNLDCGGTWSFATFGGSWAPGSNQQYSTGYYLWNTLASLWSTIHAMVPTCWNIVMEVINVQHVFSLLSSFSFT